MAHVMSDDSSDDDWEEVDSKIISVDCSAVNVLVQALRQVPELKPSNDKKAPYLQAFQPGQPPLVNFNQQLVDRVFG